MATLNPSIILSGQNPNFLRTFGEAAQTASAINDVRNTTSMRNALREYGPGLVSGDQQAQAEIARFAPETVMNVQNTRQTMDIRQQDNRRADEKLRMAQDAAKRDAARASQMMRQEEIAAQTEQDKRALGVLMQAQTPEEWDMRAAQLDPDFVGKFNDRDALVAYYSTFEDAVGMSQPSGYTQITGERAEILGLDPTKAYNYNLADQKATEIGSAGTSVTVNNQMPTDQSSLFDTLDKKQGEMFASLIDQGVQAPQKLAMVDELEGLLSQADTPEGMEAAVKSFAGNLGIPSDGLSTLQAADAIISRMVPEQRQPGSGPMSDADLALFKQSLPRLINTREGNMMIARTLRGIARYQAMQADVASRLANREITPNQARNELQQLENPLEAYRKSGPTTIGGYQIERVE